MAVQYKDYYQVLGVKRDASEKEIKDAYRRLARQWHPDRHKDQDKSKAEDRFKEIGEAYEVLKDPEKRRKYDQLGAYWRDGAEFTPPSGWDDRFRTVFESTGRRGGGGRGRGSPFSDFFEMLFGADLGGFGGGGTPASFGAADGDDVEAVLPLELGEALHGGRRRLSLDVPALCSECRGTGRKGNRVCPVCRGAGETVTRRQIEVTIPKNVAEGRTIRLSGQGRPGIGGGRDGDLLLRVRFQPHPRFRVTGDGDVEADLKVSAWDAALGASTEAPTLDGTVSVKIPAGVESGTRLRLKGRGLPRAAGGRGDQYVRIMLTVPKQPDAETKRLFEEMQRIHGAGTGAGAR
jgi:DnaJ-class molecular chaperone